MHGLIENYSKPQFVVGDVVRLKSGGPTMTIVKVRCWFGRIRYKCTWATRHVVTYYFQSAYFQEAELNKLKENASEIRN